MSEFKIQNQIEGELAEFKSKIAELKAKELQDGVTAHFNNLNPDNLNNRDMEAYRKFSDDSLSLEEFREYRSEVLSDNNKDRIGFMAFIANKITPKYLKER